MSLQLSGSSGVLDNSGAFIAGTAVASTSGTSIDFTSIPSWVKRVTVMFNGVSLSGSAGFLLQIGSGSVETTGYSSSGAYAGPTNAAGGSSSTTGFVTALTGSTNLFSGHFVFTNMGSNLWIGTHVLGLGAVSYVYSGGGTKATSGTLDRIRITTTNGTDTFDAGTINILYE